MKNLSYVVSADLPTEKFGEFQIHIFLDNRDGKEHTVLTSKLETLQGKPALIRIHSSCLTGDIFSSQRCDCGNQLDFAMREIGAVGGIFIYLNQEGRGIGLSEKIKAYNLQSNGVDTYHANIELGFDPDLRKYDIAAEILQHFNVHNVKLITNNPDKVSSLQIHGIEVSRFPSPIFCNKHNEQYLQTKATLFSHYIS